MKNTQASISHHKPNSAGWTFNTKKKKTHIFH